MLKQRHPKSRPLNTSELLYHALQTVRPSEALLKIFIDRLDKRGRLPSRDFVKLLDDLQKAGIGVY